MESFIKGEETSSQVDINRYALCISLPVIHLFLILRNTKVMSHISTKFEYAMW